VARWSAAWVAAAFLMAAQRNALLASLQRR
jgi:hypothetical protein